MLTEGPESQGPLLVGLGGTQASLLLTFARSGPGQVGR
jgi:hypothetical protein